jgi:hypothetical protein
MSELITLRKDNSNLRLGLLATTSAVVLAACVVPVQSANAADRPEVWIEGGWQFETMTGRNDVLVPPLDELTTAGFTSVPSVTGFLGQASGGFPSFTDIENVLGRSSGAEGSISFQPKGSDWILNVSARYGRAQGRRDVAQRRDSYGQSAYYNIGSHVYKGKPHFTNYVQQSVVNGETHAILDFQIGRDVGLGLFGQKSEGVFSFGARYVQMNTHSDGHAYAAPGVRFYRVGGAFNKYHFENHYQNSASVIERSNNFQGIGPSLSFSDSVGLLDGPADGLIALDWGANAAVLFGRQKAKADYSTVTRAYHITIAPDSTAGTTVHRTRSRRVTVPNLGGFAGLSYRFPNAKISAGYRADFFFGALDRGLDEHHSSTTGYHGPFATISIGLGG